MTRRDLDRYYEVLEISPGSSITDINKAYNHLRELYTTESIVTVPLSAEMTEGRRRDILAELEEARSKLTSAIRGGKEEGRGRPCPPLDEALKAELEDMVFDGPALKAIRERLRVDLHDIELATKVRAEHLKSIELENYPALPEGVFVRGYLQALARYLSLDERKVVDDYMKGYEEWKASKNGSRK